MFQNHFLRLVLEKSLREGRVITQTEIAKETGMKQPTISFWMNTSEMSKVEAHTVRALMKYLNCGMEDLLTVKDDSKIVMH